MSNTATTATTATNTVEVLIHYVWKDETYNSVIWDFDVDHYNAFVEDHHTSVGNVGFMLSMYFEDHFMEYYDNDFLAACHLYTLDNNNNYTLSTSVDPQALR